MGRLSVSNSVFGGFDSRRSWRGSRDVFFIEGL